MVKFKTTNKEQINQEFGGNPAQYTSLGLEGHNGIDYDLGWDYPIATDCDGFVYKVWRSEISPTNWQGIYILVPDGEDFVEVSYGHCLDLYVKEGDTVIEGQYIGSEGNRGYVFQGGVQITPEMQKAGDKRGAHVHVSYRPVRRATSRSKGYYYLETTKGTPYKDSEGFYYEIKERDNGYKGAVDPRNYTYKNSLWEDIIMLTKVITKLKK